MRLSTANLSLAPDAAIDLQLHTHYSDGKWTPEALLDHLVSRNFALAAITDHNRIDTTTELQALALEKRLPLLVAAEFTTNWRGDVTDILCFGFDPFAPPLQAVAADLLRRQQDNTREVFAKLHQKGIRFDQPSVLGSVLSLPGAAQSDAIVALLESAGVEHAVNLVIESGAIFAMTEIALVVDAAQRSGGLALVAHPGRGGGYVPFTVERLDQLRSEVPIDGFEAYYPLHLSEQTELFLAYAQIHDLLVSAGSDSHTPDKPPIKYPASHVRALLERLGIRVS